MRNFIIPFIFLVAFAGCIAPPSQPPSGPPRGRGDTIVQEERLFLHLLAEREYTDPQVPARRIVTARVWPNQDFAVSIGDTENPFTNHWGGAWTNPLWSETGKPEVRPLEPVFNSGDAVLAGRIERLGGKFSANLQGLNRTSLCYYHGEIELEKPVDEQGGLYRDATFRVWFVLSANPDCSRFLKELEDGTLKRPNDVDQNSQVAKDWVRRDLTNAVSPPIAEPGAAPNAASPHR